MKATRSKKAKARAEEDPRGVMLEPSQFWSKWICALSKVPIRVRQRNMLFLVLLYCAENFRRSGGWFGVPWKRLGPEFGFDTWGDLLKVLRIAERHQWIKIGRVVDEIAWVKPTGSGL